MDTNDCTLNVANNEQDHCRSNQFASSIFVSPLQTRRHSRFREGTPHAS